MDARRIRVLTAPVFAVVLLALLWVGPAVAAECALSAPSTAKVGTPLAIGGTGFPTNSIVDIELTVNGAVTNQFSVQSDAAGGFQFSLTPEATDAGKTTVVATAGSACSARVVATVLGPNDTPFLTEGPTGATGGATGTPSAPGTDRVTTLGEGSTEANLRAWTLALAALVIGAVGLIATRPTQGR